MPYRRLPKTDAARLKAMKVVLDNSDIYTVQNRFIDWKTINQLRPAYDKLFTAYEQYKISLRTQTRNATTIDKFQRNALIYVSHFLRVLLMAVERGEIKKQHLSLYGLPEDNLTLPNIKTSERLIEWGQRAIDGEKARLSDGGRPIYNPTIGMVSTHYDMFKERYNKQKSLQERAQKDLDELQSLRPEVDKLLLELWNQIEKRFENEPPEVRFEEGRKYGVVYYYRRNEEHLY